MGPADDNMRGWGCPLSLHLALHDARHGSIGMRIVHRRSSDGVGCESAIGPAEAQNAVTKDR